MVTKNNAPGLQPGARGTALRQEYCASTFNRRASRQLGRALTLLHRASRQLEAASHSAPDRYNRDHLFNLSVGLREICTPLYRAASRLEKDGDA